MTGTAVLRRTAVRVGRVLAWLASHSRPLLVALDAWAMRTVPAVCPCEHGRGQHYCGNSHCLRCGCAHYRGPWPAHHVHIMTGPCEVCLVPGFHWAFVHRGRLVRVSSLRDLPGVDR